jgi:hypothetical protein
MNAFSRLIVVGFAGTILWAACGGDDSNGGDDWTALCKKTCTKVAACFDAGGFTVNCDAQCASGADGGSGSGGCKNDDARSAAAKACLEKEACQDLFACFDAIPDCEGGGTGSGGGGGTGGAGGTGGSSGGAPDGGATCATLLACCNAATDANVKSACLMTHMNAMGNDMICSLTYSAIRGVACP